MPTSSFACGLSALAPSRCACELGFLVVKGVLLLGFSVGFLHIFSIMWLDNRAFFQIRAAIAVFSGKRGRFTPWVFCGFSPCFLHRVCWITGRLFQQHCSGDNIFSKEKILIFFIFTEVQKSISEKSISAGYLFSQQGQIT